MTVYYNENDSRAAEWLRELIRAGLIAPGEVDTRSIEDVTQNDLQGFIQCHFFAGIGGWSRALQLAQWPIDRPIWTGSCPCQPFSAAGSRTGTADERHLWPAWFHLIEQRRPPIIFGEQVASKDGFAWFDVVSADLEASGYAVGAADLCAACVGAPHIRQRLFFVAHDNRTRLNEFSASRLHDLRQCRNDVIRCSSFGQLGNADSNRAWEHAGELPANESKHEERATNGDHSSVTASAAGAPSFWADSEWIYCRDEKWRPIEPGAFPLADGVPGRVGLLRGYGNAIVPQVAAAFIEAYNEVS